MKSSVSAKGITKSGFSIPALSLMVVAVIALLVGGAFGALDLTISGVVIAALIMAVIIFFRQDELAAIIVIAVHLYIDWYLGMAFVAQFLTLFLLLIFLLAIFSPLPMGSATRFMAMDSASCACYYSGTTWHYAPGWRLLLSQCRF